MNASRPNLYRPIHKAVRLLLHRLVEQAGRTDYADGAQLAALVAAVRDGFELLQFHAEHEERFLAPLIRAAAPEVARALDAAHHDQEAQLPALLELLEEARQAGPAADAQGHAFTVALSRLAGELQVHMADEEEQAMPALQGALSDAQLMEVHQTLVGAVPPATMARWAALMLPAASVPERLALLSGVRATAPAEAFQGLLALARRVLPAEEARELEGRLLAA